MKYHLLENENKELMKLSLRLRTFSSHATVMYAKGTDYSILEVGLPCPPPSFALRRPSHERTQPSVPASSSSGGHKVKRFGVRGCRNVAAAILVPAGKQKAVFPTFLRGSVCIPDLRGDAALLRGSFSSSSGRRLKLINHHQLILLRSIKTDDDGRPLQTGLSPRPDHSAAIFVWGMKG